MSSDGYSNKQYIKILNRHSDNHQRKASGEAVTSVVVPILRFR